MSKFARTMLACSIILLAIVAFTGCSIGVKKYSVTVISTIGGTVQGGATYNEGATATVTAIPTAGYFFVNWTKSNISSSNIVVSEDTTYSFTVSENIVLTAHFVQEVSAGYTVTVTNTVGGTTTGAGNYQEGDTATLTATATSGYDFYGWYLGEERVSIPASYSVTISNDVTYRAVFLQVISYTATVVGEYDGSAIQSISNTVDPMRAQVITNSYVVDLVNYTKTTAITVTAWIKAGEPYQFVGWRLNGTYLSAVSTVSTVKLTENSIFTAIFTGTTNTFVPQNFHETSLNVLYTYYFDDQNNVEYTKYLYNYVANTYSISENYTGIYIVCGQYIVIEHDDVYEIYYYEMSGHQLTLDNLNSTTPILVLSGTEDITDIYTVKLMGSTGGTISGYGVYIINDSITVQATPFQNYVFIGWRLNDANGTIISSNPNYTFTLSSNIVLYAEFEYNNEVIIVPE